MELDLLQETLGQGKPLPLPVKMNEFRFFLRALLTKEVYVFCLCLLSWLREGDQGHNNKKAYSLELAQGNRFRKIKRLYGN